MKRDNAGDNGFSRLPNLCILLFFCLQMGDGLNKMGTQAVLPLTYRLVPAGITRVTGGIRSVICQDLASPIV